ncbi:hypothetical protein SAMN05216238_104177 [Lentibacillus persicus]|uniref:Uncharacterized protein n=1 Tax=Lentibacillus persicus TaxID=640948 RepID=A0A1I1VDA8_9BACI|nr:hypothetical protein SAMN05216238_104177 [Lentibacillus persicus]
MSKIRHKPLILVKLIDFLYNGYAVKFDGRMKDEHS